MPRSATRRRADLRRRAAIVVGAVVLLSSCSDSGGDEGTPTAKPTPVVAPTAATSVADQVVAAAVDARSDVSKSGAAARKKTFTGPALTAANAFAKTLPARSSAQKADAELSTTGVKVLGVSRAGESPRQIVAQTSRVKGDGAVLVLLTSASASADFQVAAITPMVTDSTLEAFDPTSLGSAPVGSGDGLVAEPEAVLSAFATAVSFPKPTKTALLTSDPVSEQLRASAAAQAKTLAGRGSFTQTHEPKGVIGGLRLANRAGAVVFARLERQDSIALREADKLKPAKEVTLVSGLKQITTEAVLRTDEAVALVIPTTGTSRVVGYADQLVDATGR